VALFDAETQTLHLDAYRGPSTTEAYAGVAFPVLPGYGASAAAVSRRASVTTSDALIDPVFEHVRDVVRAIGLRSMLAVPIFDSAGNVLGTFSIGARQPNASLFRYQRLIDIAAQTAAIAIENARADKVLREANASLQREVDERRAAEEALRDSQGRLQTALQHTRMGTWTFDLVKNSGYSDPTTLAILGRSADELDQTPTDFFKYVHPDDCDRLKSLMVAVAKGEAEYETEYRFLRADGIYCWISARARVERDAEGRPVRLIGVSWDVTERRSTEALITNQNRVLAMIAAGAPLAETLDALTSLIEPAREDLYGAVWLLDAETQRLRLVAYRGPSTPEIESGAEFPAAPGYGTSAAAVCERACVSTSDMLVDPAWEHSRDRAIALGLRSCLAAPIIDSAGNVLGTFSISARQPDAPLYRHRRGIDIAVQTAAIAIESSRAAQALRDANVALAGEVVERRTAEEELRNARVQLQSALEHARMGTWIYDVPRGSARLDSALLKVLGAPAGDSGEVIVDAYLTDVVHPEDRDRVRAELEAAIRGERDLDTELRLFRQDRSVTWLAVKALVQRAGDGTALRMVGVASDITERKAAEAFIAGQNRVLAMIAASAPLPETMEALAQTVRGIGRDQLCAIWLLDADGQHLHLSYWSGRPLPLTAGQRSTMPVAFGYGASPVAVMRRELVVTTDMASDPVCEHVRGQALAAGMRASWASPIIDSAGKVVGTVAMAAAKPGAPTPRDLQALEILTKTAAIAIESARAAEALHDAHENLERKVAERTRELVAANEQLKELDRLKSQFLANMSHELRTPLNAIIGFTGTMLMRLPGPLTRDQESQLGIVRSSAQHLLSLINDLLDLAKIEAGKMVLKLEPVACQDVIREVVATLQPLADRKKLVLDVELPKAAVTIDTDLRSLKQIVLNLANNAIKFTDKGGVRLALHRLTRDGRNYVEISIADTGIGIRPEDRERLFQAFAQTAGGISDGTGLGLHLSQKFAQLIGGRIEFESEYGQGSRFALLLPGE
jgi:PAS domain S-box-containing protein